jgi:putative DNA primase/helicase
MTGEEALRDAMRQQGIEYDGPICIDGKLHRFKAIGDDAKNSWYALHAGSPVVGAFGCWKRGLSVHHWCERGDANLSKKEQQHIHKRQQKISAKLKAETLRRQTKAAKTAAWILERSRPAATLHGYVARKRVKVYGDLRASRGKLVVPLRDSSGELHSLQFIDAKGGKKFLHGGRVAGCFFTLADNADGPLVICEAYATGASIHEATGHAVISAMSSGNLLAVAKAAREVWPEREIVVAADNDQFTHGNPGLTKGAAAAKAIRGNLAVPQFADIANKPSDFNDLALAQGLGAVREGLGKARPVMGETDSVNSLQTSDEEIIARLAAMPLLEYERCREAEAEKLGCRVAKLDQLIDTQRLLANAAHDALQGAAVDLADVEPWTEVVNGVAVLDEIAERTAAYVVMPPGAADVTALWIAHTHCYKVFTHTPRLNASSAERNSGKTTLRDVCAEFVARPLLTENTTCAVLFRLVHAQAPTLFADEYDAWLKDNEELRGLLNAGHRRGAIVHRCEGDGFAVRGFSVFAPVMLCGIGALPGTLHDRSIVIRLPRAKRGEIKARFDPRHVEVENELCRKLARWVADNRERIAACEPRLPEGMFNRVADNWRPLFAIAEVAGGNWPQRCANAYSKLQSSEFEDAETLRVGLLTDIQQIFAGTWPPLDEGEEPTAIDRIFSKQLCEKLVEMKERPWPEIRKGKGITERWLAYNLAAFGIRPKMMRIGDDSARGYMLTEFKDAFERYVMPSKPEIPPFEVQHRNNASENAEKRSATKNENVADVNASEERPKYQLANDFTESGCGVADKKQGDGGNEASMGYLEL